MIREPQDQADELAAEGCAAEFDAMTPEQHAALPMLDWDAMPAFDQCECATRRRENATRRARFGIAPITLNTLTSSNYGS
jgi:hypothetical protein